MKQLIILFVSALVSINSFAKDLHFIYIRFDNSMENEKLKKQIEKLKTSLTESDFILYYSNEKTTMDNQSWDKNKLFAQINSQNSSVAISIPDELETISILLENQLPEESYSAIHFDCFVGNDFFNNNYQDMLLARMLIVNGLLKSKYIITLQYFPCGATYNYEKIKFKPEYKINFTAQIISSL